MNQILYLSSIFLDKFWRKKIPDGINDSMYKAKFVNEVLFNSVTWLLFLCRISPIHYVYIHTLKYGSRVFFPYLVALIPQGNGVGKWLLCRGMFRSLANNNLPSPHPHLLKTMTYDLELHFKQYCCAAYTKIHYTVFTFYDLLKEKSLFSEVIFRKYSHFNHFPPSL